MSLSVKVCFYENLPTDLQEEFRDEGSFLLVEHDGELVRCESASIEPEDVSFFRDLRWVGDAIMEAYALGREDYILGREDAKE